MIAEETRTGSKSTSAETVRAISGLESDNGKVCTFTDGSVVTSMSEKPLILSSDYIGQCIGAMLSLNVSTDNEISISYIQHKDTPCLQGCNQLETNNTTVPQCNPGCQRGSSQTRHQVDVEHKQLLASVAGSCSIRIIAPPGKMLSILFLNQTCSRGNQVHVEDTHDGWSTTLNGCSPWKTPGYDVTTTNGSAVLELDARNPEEFFRLKVHIKAMAVQLPNSHLTRYVSPALGYFQTSGWHPFARKFAIVETSTAVVLVPSNSATLISAVYLKVVHRVALFSFNKTSGRPRKPLLTPQRRPDGLWNCSVTFWPDFHQHFVCNHKTECSSREDEMWCPDTSCQQGGVLINEVCYVFVRLPSPQNTWHHGNLACRRRGAALASFMGATRWYYFSLLTQLKLFTDVIYIGLQSADFSYPHIIVCPDQHWTHRFLACDAFSACFNGYDVRSGDVCGTPGHAATSFKALFPCKKIASSVPYSLVCNHLQDCEDNSDEDFCVFPPCSAVSQYKCANGQCLPHHYHCDGLVQCVDESDELDCSLSRTIDNKGGGPRPPAIVNFNGRGWMVYRPLTMRRENSAAICPDTHVFCSSNGYCLPVYIRCNGVYDCPGREDEAGCDSYTCPGLYRCRGFLNTCLHPHHLCDGWPQCSQIDDELFCNLTCPDSCTCLGHAFTCVGDFHAEPFSRLRYLDASGTGLQPRRLMNNLMLVFLSLADCDLAHMDNMTLSNLLTLDLSDNRFNNVTVPELNLMKNLQNLSLARNPLSMLFSGNSSSGFLVHENILHVDLTGVELKVLDMPNYLPFPSLLSLNMSESGVTHLVGNGFRSLTSLHILDLRGCPMAVYPKRVFTDLKKLYLVFADNYRLCCEANLPEGFIMDKCQAPFNELSSCIGLLRTDTYRICLYVLTVLAISGNLGCFSLRIFAQTGRSETSFNVFVTHLCVSDFMMGAYMAMIGVADRLYLGRYVWEEDNWRHSAACKVAGVFAFLSSEMSAFIICFITVDRFLVIRFPFSRLRFSFVSSRVACLMAWTVSAVLVTVPLLPFTAYGQFYEQSGICVPLPINRKIFAGRHYSFGVMILFNLIIFVMVAIGQVSIYLSIMDNAVTSVNAARKPRDVIVARRLITVVATDFFCWFPVGLTGVLAAQGVPVPGEVNVASAVFVLPLNSALNPFIYTLNIIQEKRQRATEVKLLKLIMDRELTRREKVNDE